MALPKADFVSGEAEPTRLGQDPIRRRQCLTRNPPGPEGLVGGGASAVLRSLAVAPATARAARLASAPSPSQRGSCGILRQAPIGRWYTCPPEITISASHAATVRVHWPSSLSGDRRFAVRRRGNLL